MPWVSLNDIGALGQSEISATLETISELGLANSSARLLPVGTVILSRTASVGKSTILARPMATTQDFANFVCGPEVHNRYLMYLFRYLQGTWKQLMAGSIHNTIYMPAFKALQVLLPPPAEQHAIAEALEDTDGLIEAVKALIAKKRAIKQGLMRNLLTGRLRLPGFQGEWTKEVLGTLGQWKGGATPSMSRPDFWQGGTIPWVSSSDVRVGAVTPNHLITEKAVKESSTAVVPPGAILFVTRSGILRRFLPLALAPSRIAINQDIKALLPRAGVFEKFIFHALVGVSDDILACCLKSGTTVESLELSWLKKFEIGFPPTLDEQRAIADVLSDMDAEIAALEVKLAKTKAVKQGMMQVLLTGEARLT